MGGMYEGRRQVAVSTLHGRLKRGQVQDRPNLEGLVGTGNGGYAVAVSNARQDNKSRKRSLGRCSGDSG